MPTETFNTVGAHEWTVPDGVTEITATLYGAEGAPGDGEAGQGGETVATLPVSAGETLNLHVGGQASGSTGGANGGGDGGTGSTGGGGGASDLRQGGDTLDDRALVAGGGGGGNERLGGTGPLAAGGDGGGLQGGDGEDGDAPGGTGGTQSAGGTAQNGGDGSFGVGGDGGDGGSTFPSGGGAGGGWYGGGGGSNYGGSSGSGGAGGGGSSYIDDAATDSSTTAGVNSGDGEITIEYQVEIDSVDDLAPTSGTTEQIGLGWTAPDHGVDRQDLYRDTEPGIDPVNFLGPHAELGPDADSFSDAGLDNGTEYYYRLELIGTEETGGETELSNETSATTTVPPIEELLAEAAGDQELEISWTTDQNAGNIHVEYRESGADAWIDHDTLSYTATETTITGLTSDTQYDVRVRGETADATGAWSEDTATTLQPDFSFQFTTAPTSVDVSWTDPDDRDVEEQVLQRQREYPSGWGTVETVATLGASVTSYTDDAVHPNATYRYRIQAVETSETTNSQWSPSATTDGTGKPTTRVPARGWYVEIDGPGGSTHRPSILNDAQIVPRVNGLPQVRIPVRKSDKWQADAFELAPMRVWRDGTRQPADVLVDVEQQPGRTVLVGRGGEQLRERVEAEYDDVPVHEVVEELLAQETDYAANVDTPPVEEFDDVVLDATTGSAIADALDRDATTPFVARDGDLQLAHTAHLFNAGDTDQVSYSGGTDERADDYTGGFARGLDEPGDAITSNDFELEYDIPADAVGIAVRWAWLDPPTDIEIAVVDATDDTAVGAITLGHVDSTTNVAWDFDTTNTIGDPWDSGMIPAGDYYLEVTGLDSVSGSSIVDMICLFDRRYYDTSSDFDNTVHEAEGHLDSPALHPAEATVWTEALPTVLSVIGGTVDVTIDDTSGNQGLGVTNDGEDALVTASNTDTVTGDFGARTGEIQAQITLSNTEPSVRNDATPRSGYESQRISALSITGEFDDMPLVLNRTFDDRLVNILRELAGQLSDSVFAVGAQADGTGVVEWAEREQRTTTVDDSLADFEVVTTRDPIERAIVYGSNQAVRREPFDAAHGTAVSLDRERLSEGSVSVYDPDGQAQFERGEDYEISHRDGTITALAGGDLVDGQTYRVDYEFQTRGSYTADGVDPADANTEVADIAGLTTDRSCGQAAYRIVQTGIEPRHEVTATWPVDADLPPVTDALIVDGLPIDAAIQTNKVEASPSELVTTGGSRRPVEDVIREINERVSSVSRQV